MNYFISHYGDKLCHLHRKHMGYEVFTSWCGRGGGYLLRGFEEEEGYSDTWCVYKLKIRRREDVCILITSSRLSACCIVAFRQSNCLASFLNNCIAITNPFPLHMCISLCISGVTENWISFWKQTDMGPWLWNATRTEVTIVTPFWWQGSLDRIPVLGIVFNATSSNMLKWYSVTHEIASHLFHFKRTFFTQLVGTRFSNCCQS